MKRWGCLVSIGILLLFLACGGLFVPLETVVRLAIGWTLFLAEVVPRLSVSWSGVATAAVALALFIVGFQRLATWCFSAVGVTGEQAPQRTWKWRWTFLTAAVILLSFIAGIAVVGGVHQVVWMATSDKPLTNSADNAFRRSYSKNNFRALALALDQYHDKHSQFPAGGTFDRLGQPLVSWQTALLPFIGQSDLYGRMRLDLSWDAPENSDAMGVIVPEYVNSAIGSKYAIDPAGKALSHYAGNALILGPHPGLKPAAITDGMSQTFVAGEAQGNYRPWGSPLNWRDARLGINRSPDGFGGPWEGGAHLMIADGSVRFVSGKIDQKVLNALATPNGGETIDNDSW